MLEGGLVSFLAAQAPLTAIIGTNIYDTVAPEMMVRPDGNPAYPCLVFQVVSYAKEYAQQGDAGVAQKRIIFTAISTLNTDVRNTREAVRAALTGFGPAELPDGTQVFDIELVAQHDDFSVDSRMYRATLHAMVQYAE
jgi:hypothetical protein